MKKGIFHYYYEIAAQARNDTWIYSFYPRRLPRFARNDTIRLFFLSYEFAVYARNEICGMRLNSENEHKRQLNLLPDLFF